MSLHRLALVVAAGCPLLAGCATVVNGRTASVKLTSNPPQALATVRDHEGTVVAQTMTPGEVTLKRGRPWLRPATYSATFEKPGYYASEAPIGTKVNPWILGNVVLGGPFGLGVDLASGALWRPAHSTVGQDLAYAGDPYGGAVQTASAEQPTMAR